MVKVKGKILKKGFFLKQGKKFWGLKKAGVFLGGGGGGGERALVSL